MDTRRKHGRIRDELPDEVRAQVDRMMVEGNTYDDIKAWLDSKGFNIGRSSIGRYGKDFFNDLQQTRIIEEKARALVTDVEDGMVLEEAASKLFSKQIIEGLMDGQINIKKLPRIISDFAKLQASTVLRERLKKEIAKKAQQAVESIKKKVRNIEPDTLRVIKEEIYGLVD